jgi:hypothetical protein
MRLAAAGPGASVRRFTGHPAAHVAFSPSSSSLALAPPHGHGHSSSGDDGGEAERRVEEEVCAWLTSLRADKGLPTQFDPTLAVLLQPALVAYELERTLGVGLTGEASQMHKDFQSAIRHYVGTAGESFKAYPTCFSHADPGAVRHAVAAAAAAKDVAGLAQATFAVRAKVFPFPAGVRCCWVMVGVRYTPLRIAVHQ